MSAASLVTITMDRIELSVGLGEHPWEKHPQRPTRVLINIDLRIAFADYFSKHGGYVDYDPLRQFLLSLEGREHVDRIEVFSRTILDACFSLTPAQSVALSIIKPDIFDEMQGVGVTFDVTREDYLQ